MKKLTINEIAKMARVSKGTVSKILNNRHDVGPETRKRVLELVDRLGYVPDSSAQALAFSKTSNIGLIIPHEAQMSLNGHYWSSIIASVAGETAKQNNNLMVFTIKDERTLGDLYDSILSSRKIDGLVVGAEQFNKNCHSILESNGIPYVLIGRSADVETPAVDVDNYQAAADMAEYLIRQGYRRIMFISGPREYLYSQNRIEGFRGVLEKHQMPYFVESVQDYSEKSVQNLFSEILNRGELPDAFFLGAGGQFLFDVLKVFKQEGLNPDDFGLAIFDDYPFLEYLSRPITALQQPLEYLGRMAVAMLMSLIQGEELLESIKVLSMVIIPRKSCGEE